MLIRRQKSCRLPSPESGGAVRIAVDRAIFHRLLVSSCFIVKVSSHAIVPLRLWPVRQLRRPAKGQGCRWPCDNIGTVGNTSARLTSSRYCNAGEGAHVVFQPCASGPARPDGGDL